MLTINSAMRVAAISSFGYPEAVAVSDGCGGGDLGEAAVVGDGGEAAGAATAAG